MELVQKLCREKDNAIIVYWKIIILLKLIEEYKIGDVGVIRPIPRREEPA